MKNLAFISLVISIVAFVSGCNKSSGSVNPTSSSIAGNWSLVRDSTINGTTYYGVSTDYYKFTTNGQLYIKEGNFILDTATYRLAAKDSVILQYKYFNEYGYLIKGNVANDIYSNLTSSTLTLNSGGLSPEGYYGNIITLRKTDLP